MNTPVANKTSKLAFEKSRSALNTANNKEKKMQAQTLNSSSFLQTKKKRQQSSNTNSHSNIEKQQIESSNNSKNNPEVKTLHSLLEKGSTVTIEEQGMPVTKRVKNPEEKTRILTTKTKNTQQSKQTSTQRESLKPIKPKAQEKPKQFCQQGKSHCAIKSNVFSINFQADYKDYHQILKKLNETMQENKQLKSKIDILKLSNQQSKRYLRDQVVSFNLEGEEAKKSKETLEQLQLHNQQLRQEINRITQENVIYTAKIEEVNCKVEVQEAEKKQLQIQNQLQHINFCQLKEEYTALKQKYQAQAKILEEKESQINQLTAGKSEVASLQLQSKLSQSSPYVDQITDLSINSQLKDDQPHPFKPLLVQTLPQDADIVEMVRRVVEKYTSWIDELKNRIALCQMQNLELEAEIDKLRQNTHYQPQKIDLNTQTKILLLLQQNNRLKIIEYETREETKQVTEKLKLLEFENKQLAIEKEVKDGQLSTMQSQLGQTKLEQQLLQEEQQSLKCQLQQHQSVIKQLKMQKQQDSLARAPTVKKVKFFK